MFIKKYEVMHRFVAELGGTVLYIGEENWPFPIPLAKNEPALIRLGTPEMGADRGESRTLRGNKCYLDTEGKPRYFSAHRS
jgi:hypothetical protein